MADFIYQEPEINIEDFVKSAFSLVVKAFENNPIVLPPVLCSLFKQQRSFIPNSYYEELARNMKKSLLPGEIGIYGGYRLVQNEMIPKSRKGNNG